MNSIQFNISGVIKKPKKIQANVNGVIKNIKKVQANISGVIKTIYNQYPLYNQSGLIMLLDAIENTLNGHSTSTTTWYDLSGHNNNIILTGVTWNENSAIFAGSTNSKGTSSITLSNPYTVEVVLGDKTNWINGVNIPFSNYNLSSSISGDGIILRSTTGEVSFRVGTIKTISTAKTNFNETNVVTYQNNGAGTGYFYLNGSLIGSTTGVSTSGSTNTITLGYSQTFPYKGTIKSVRIYNRILTSAEISANYLIDYDRFM